MARQRSNGPTSQLPNSVILLGLMSLFNDSASEMIYPLLPVFLTSTLGATPLIVGLVEGAAEALSSILKLVAGWISDRLPRRKPLIVGGYALATASRAWISLAGSWPSVLGARLLDRTGVPPLGRDNTGCQLAPPSRAPAGCAAWNGVGR